MFFFGFTSTPAKPPLALYNTLTGKKEPFEPLAEKEVRMYTCGPTVYNFVHIGNLRAYVFADTLRRVLEFAGFTVKHVMNITDVGHLTSDADLGEDKMMKALKREGKPMTLEAMREIADTYTEAFKSDIGALNIKEPAVLCRATDHIESMIALIQTLMEKEFAYKTSDGVYFDTARFEGYGKLGGIDIAALKAGARVEAHPEKRNPQDFVLWKKSTEEGLGWASPWGVGFPGWHIECSAMSMQYLGKSFDIHTGGVDHIGTHHNNEIAQSEAATGRPLARFWMHNEFINIDGAKISKSLENELYLRSLIEHGYPALSYRYWLLTSHYRQPANFTFQALDGAKTAYLRLVKYFTEELLAKTGGAASETYLHRFRDALYDDLNTAAGIAILWELVKDPNISAADKRATLLAFDKALGLGLSEIRKEAALRMTKVSVVLAADLPDDVRTLVAERESMRTQKRWDEADAVRRTIAKKGFLIKDTPKGPEITTLH